eukprot:2693415-Alexandrium_andersonii.AAC.1
MCASGMRAAVQRSPTACTARQTPCERPHPACAHLACARSRSTQSNSGLAEGRLRSSTLVMGGGP